MIWVSLRQVRRQLNQLPHPHQEGIMFHRSRHLKHHLTVWNDYSTNTLNWRRAPQGRGQRSGYDWVIKERLSSTSSSSQPSWRPRLGSNTYCYFSLGEKVIYRRRSEKEVWKKLDQQCWYEGCSQTSGNIKLLCNEHTVSLNPCLSYNAETNEYFWVPFMIMINSFL